MQLFRCRLNASTVYKLLIIIKGEKLTSQYFYRYFFKNNGRAPPQFVTFSKFKASIGCNSGAIEQNENFQNDRKFEQTQASIFTSQVSARVKKAGF